MQKPEGTVKSHLNRMRRKLADVPAIRERAGDLLGDAFGEGLKRTAQHHSDDEGVGGRS